MEHEYKKESVLFSPWRLAFRLLIIIFLVEAVIRFVLITFFPEEHGVLISIADAAMAVPDDSHADRGNRLHARKKGERL